VLPADGRRTSGEVGVGEVCSEAGSDEGSVVGVAGVGVTVVGATDVGVSVGSANVGRGDGCNNGASPSLAPTGRTSRATRRNVAPTARRACAAMCILVILSTFLFSLSISFSISYSVSIGI
jgi:hypothetical protein